LFQIQPAHLRAAGGELRCGRCGTTFNATSAVFEDPQQALDYQYPPQADISREIDDLVSRALDQVSAGGEAEPVDTGVEIPAGEYPAPMEEVQAIEPPQPEQDQQADTGAGIPVSEELERAADQATAIEHVDQEASEAEAGPADEQLIEEIVIETADVSPPRRGFEADTDFHAWPPAAEFGQRGQEEAEEEPDLSLAILLEDAHHEQVTHTSWGSIAATFLLIFALVGQYAYAERYRLVKNPQLRPTLEMFCARLQCDLPLRRDTGSVQIVKREIRDHPHVKDALLVNATFVNRAAFVQALPVVQVSFSDMSGTPVAVRRFTPEEYLSTQQGIPDGIAPGEQQHLLLELIDPGDRAVSFQFDFL
jgi:predicted Zn finger-like uncharacterized protein